MRLVARRFEKCLRIGRGQILQERFGGSWVACVRRDESHDRDGRANLSWQHADDVVLVLVGEHVAEEEHAEAEVAARELFLNGEDRAGGAGGGRLETV